MGKLIDNGEHYMLEKNENAKFYYNLHTTELIMDSNSLIIYKLNNVGIKNNIKIELNKYNYFTGQLPITLLKNLDKKLLRNLQWIPFANNVYIASSSASDKLQLTNIIHILEKLSANIIAVKQQDLFLDLTRFNAFNNSKNVNYPEFIISH